MSVEHKNLLRRAGQAVKTITIAAVLGGLAGGGRIAQANPDISRLDDAPGKPTTLATVPFGVPDVRPQFSPEKEERHYTSFRNYVPSGVRVLFAEPHSKASVVQVRPKALEEGILPFSEIVEGENLQWKNIPKSGFMTSTNEWLHTQIYEAEGFIWLGFTGLAYSEPMTNVAKVPVLGCIGKMTNVSAFKPEGGGGIGIDDSDVQKLFTLRGQNIWLGYGPEGVANLVIGADIGFAMPQDAKHIWLIRGEGAKKQEVQVWIYESEKYHKYIYFLPFTSTEISADNKGEHLGIHPCGGYAVPTPEAQPVLDSFLKI